MKRYKVIFNFDTSGVIGQGDGIVEGSAKTTEEYITRIVHVLKGQSAIEVDAIFWCDGAGGNSANWDSEVLEKSAERIGKVDPLLIKMIEEGNDPPLVAIRECRKLGKDVFYSFRLNDLHDCIESRAHLLATFKVEHPEWTLEKGESEGPVLSGHPYGSHRALDFAVPEVRDLKFAVVEEVFRKYDFDGLEIDFMRSPPYFTPGTEPENAHIMTKFLRRIRNHLAERGKQRGRPIALAVRVDESLEACRLDGFDVATWMKERLVDIVALGSGAIDMEVEAFKDLAQGTDVLVYPCVYGHHSGYRPNTTEMARALATNYWHQGADGIYLFNYGPIPCEFHDPEAMRGKDKFFAADRATRTWTYPHNWMHCVLPANVKPAKPADVPIMVGDDLTKAPRPANIEFKVICSEVTDDNELSLTLNRAPLPDLSQPDTWQRQNLSSCNLWESATAFAIQLKPDQLKLGRNNVGISVGEGEVIARAAEVRVSY